MAQSILYYPSININDGTWLRNALLYWDNLSSIVPYENYADLSPELLYLENAGIYRPIYPCDLFCTEYSELFIEEFVRRLTRYQNSLHREQNKNMGRVRIHRNKIYAPAWHEMIHYNKIPTELHKLLISNGFVHDYNCDGWMEMDSKVAQIYMRTFAEYVIKCYDENFVIGTDKRNYQKEIYRNTSRRESTSCVSISLEKCLPQPNLEIGFEELLDFKNAHKDDLLYFRDMLRKYETALSDCESGEEINAQTENFKESWQRALIDAKKLFTQERGAFVWGSLQTLIATPSLVDPYMDYINDMPIEKSGTIATAAILGGAACIGVKKCYIAYRNKVNAKRDSAGFAYLLKAAQSDIISF